MKKMFNLVLGFFLGIPTMLFGAPSGSPLSKITQEAGKQIESAGSDLAGLVNVIAGSLGFLWLIIMLLMYLFAPEQLKQNMKILVGVGILLGVVYVISAAY